MLRLIDGGEQDDKLLAVTTDGPFADVTDLDELNARFPVVTAIVETWFVSYKGAGRLESRGFAGPEEARRILAAAVAAFEPRRS